jgi:membrane-associated phospholipid phosphatase
LGKKQKDWLNRYLPKWEILPLCLILAVNCVVYWGSAFLTANRYHYDLTSAFDRAVPFLPVFIWIYILAFPFWAVNYILAAQRGKDMFYRFVATDLTVHMACFLIFLIIPTTNVRPEITGDSISEKMLALIYALDGGENPSNLFPSIHCYLSWLCYRGLRKAKEIPVWYQRFSLVFAILIIISTQVLKQHYLVDAISGVVLVELAWGFFQKGERHKKLQSFLENCSEKFKLNE